MKWPWRLEVSLSFTFGPDGGDNGPGDITTAPVGFAPSPGDQRWKSIPAPGEGDL